MNLEECVQVIMMYAAAFPSWHPTEPTYRTWGAVLAPLPVAAVREATLRILREDREFAPSAGTMYARSVKLIQEAEGRPEIDLESAWSEVQLAIDSIGGYRRPQWSHPSIAAAVDAIGWEHICRDENLVATRAHFFRLLESNQRRAFEDASLRLAGPTNSLLADLTRSIGKPMQ